MKEIKFRAWDELGKVMHHNFQWMQSGNEGNDWVVFKSDKQPIMNDAIKNPFFSQQLRKMQFTGLKDKKGNDIYEGDILESANGEDTYQIIWQHAGWFKKPLNGNWNITSLYVGYKHQTVIGNVFQGISKKQMTNG